MRVIIPTRNRPTSLMGVLDYLTRFHPTTEVIVADGSTPEFQAENQRNVASRYTNVDFRPYSEDLPLFDRLLDVLNTETDKYFLISADDDYPMIDNLEIARKRIDNDPEVLCAAGFLMHMSLFEDGTMNTRLDLVRPINGPSATKRMRAFSQWPFTTTYTVATRDLLIDRYEQLKTSHMPGFFDFSVGLADCAKGKIAAIPDLGFICTRNFNHSYYRATEPLIYLRRSEDVLNIYNRIVRDAMTYDNVTQQEAEDLGVALINRRVAGLAGVPPYRVEGFKENGPYSSEFFKKQRDRFKSIFVEGTDARAKYEERLLFIRDRLKSSVSSNDNQNESATYEKL